MWGMHSSTWLILAWLFHSTRYVSYIISWMLMIRPRKLKLDIPIWQSFNGKKWEKFNSEKVASLAYARIQGKSALIAHFQNSSLMNEDKRCRPILFNTDGPNAGDQVWEPYLNQLFAVLILLKILQQDIGNSKCWLFTPKFVFCNLFLDRIFWIMTQ